MTRKLAGAAIVFGLAVFAQDPEHKKGNRPDRQANEMTADDQGNSKQDVDTTRQIRKQLMDETTLSTNAKNIKVITKDGRVTLRGQVNTSDEKDKVEKIAKQVAGMEKVKSEVEVAAK